MSRIDELKKQYPELNLSFFDMMVRLDTTKSHKYLSLMCKIFGKKFSVKHQCHKDDLLNYNLDIQSSLMNKGISTENLTENQMYFMAYYLSDNFNMDTYSTIKSFMDYMDRGMIEKNDVSEYRDIEDIRGAITLASMKEYTKELESQIIKEYEDERWLILRPLTFSASAKYGSSTRWCTTYQKEKNYFEKYWRRGILVYFINKQTGYKFAGYKGLNDDNEFSFWNSEDIRVDYLDVDADDYLFPIVRKIFKSNSTNKNLCSDEIQEQVHTECIKEYAKMRIEFSDEAIPLDEQIQEEILEQPDFESTLRDRLIEATRELRPEPVNVPVMRA